MAIPSSLNEYTSLFVGTEVEVPVLDGTTRRYINFDNAASTPPLKAVMETIANFMPYYSSVHRGTGFKSQLATHAYEEARKIVIEFLGADTDTHVCIFGKNSTEALNKLARRFPFSPERNVVLTSVMEHHSNDLPWREVAEVVHVRLHSDGRLDLQDFDKQIAKHSERIALVAINGGSNVSGFISPIHDMAEKAHAVGAHIAVDCAQLAPHRSVKMGVLDDPHHIDYAIISAHKMYAPYGTGALVGRRDTFERGKPDMVGGGVVEIVTLEKAYWAEPPDRDEAGSPNVAGAVALAAAIRDLTKIGMRSIAAHEAELTSHALTRMAEVPNIILYGDSNPQNAADRLGVLPFQVEGVDHFLAAAILGYEFGIGVRNGCFCAHPLILHLLGISGNEADQVRDDILRHDKTEMPGLIRASFGLYNTIEEVDDFIDALEKIATGAYKGTYQQDVPTGEYYPKDWLPNFDHYFTLRQ